MQKDVNPFCPAGADAASGVVEAEQALEDLDDEFADRGLMLRRLGEHDHRDLVATSGKCARGCDVVCEAVSCEVFGRLAIVERRAAMTINGLTMVMRENVPKKRVVCGGGVVKCDVDKHIVAACCCILFVRLLDACVMETVGNGVDWRPSCVRLVLFVAVDRVDQTQNVDLDAAALARR